MWTYAREKKMKNTHTLNWERPYKENILSSFFLRWLCRCHTDCHKQDKRKKKKTDEIQIHEDIIMIRFQIQPQNYVGLSWQLQ